jgi:TRAP-type C4-dicarboxylate transport system permease small subunit
MLNNNSKGIAVENIQSDKERLFSVIQDRVENIGNRINWLNERVVGLLIMLLILDVWLGVVDRYVFHWQIPWTEELARYIMIWGVLLAVPCCCYRREHIGLAILQNRLPTSVLRIVNVILDLVAFILFTLIAFTGATFAEKGLQQTSMVFGMSMFVPYAVIPVTFGLSALQTLFALIRDLGRFYANDDALGGTDI